MIRIGNDILGYDIPTQGRIRNLNVYQSSTNQIECLFEHEGALTDQHHALTYVNGELQGIDADGVAAIPNLSAGNQNVNVIPQIESDAISPIYFDEADGQRVILRWTPDATNVLGYKVYQTDLSGLNPVLLETITRRELERASLRYPDSGATGAGRISCPPWPLPEAAYGSLVITITDEGEFSYTLGDESGTGTFIAGSTQYMAYGVGIHFHDDLAEYGVGDTYTLAAGPKAEWLSDTLAAGDYRFGITTFTDTDDESDMTLTQVFEIVEQSSAVSAYSAAWNDTTKELAITFTLPSGAASVNLYSNFYEDEGYLADYASLDAQANSTTGFTLSFGTVEGEFLYYLRPVTADGVELQDFTLNTVTIPDLLGAVVLSEPAGLSGNRVGALNWEIEFAYFAEENDACTEFTVHRVPEAGTFTYDATDLVTTITATHAVGIEEDYSYQHLTETESAGVLKIQVLAHAATGETTYSDIIEITTVASAPVTAPGGLIGGTA